MKKLLALTLALLMVAAAFVGCGDKAPNSSETPSDTGSEYKLGLATNVVYADAQTGKVAADTNVAAVILDKDGKIVDCVFDAVSASVEIADGLLADGADKLTFKSKHDLGDAYNMKTYGGAVAEWYEQANAFAEFCVGKTAAEVKATALNDKGVPTAADLTASCTIGVTDYVAAIVKACEDAAAKSFKASGDIKLGLTVDGKVEAAKDSEANDGSVKYLTTVAASAVVDGKLAAAIVDAAQPEFTFDDTGAVTAAKYNGTKRELKDNYGMVAYANAKAEWYKQAEALENACVGKTADEVKSVANAEGKAANADLAANCTIAVGGDVANIVTAMGKAK